MFQWLRRLWHFNDEHCSPPDIAMTEEQKRRFGELMKLNGNVPVVPHVVDSRDGHTYPR